MASISKTITKGEEVDDNEKLLRRVLYLDPNHIKPDGQPSSLAFSLKKGEDGLSVDVESLTTYSKSILDVSRFRLYKLDISYIKSIGLTCVHDPKDDGSNDAHSLIKGDITRPIAKKLAQEASKVNYP